MKLKSDIWQVTSDKNRNRLRCGKSSTHHSSPVTHHASPITHHSSLITHHSQRGIALVITLILLSVTLVMAIAFLALSNRERKSVATVTDTATARLAAETALAKAESQIIAGILTSTNGAGAYNYGLLVSTNYINPYGFVDGIANPTNVNYDYIATSSNFLTSDQLMQNIANLLFLPRVPVFIVTNQQTKASDFRFYLDLNRNGKFDDTGNNLIELDTNGLATGNQVSEVGDPQWVGVLERPDTTHGPNNKFVSRYAFIALPVGNSLDLNYIHNQVFDENTPNSTVSSNLSDAFFRNQGVGSWEINLAAFLADLNANEWGQVIGTSANGNTTYYYYQYPPGGNRGLAFADAQDLLGWRYNNDYSLLATADQLFPTANTVFPNDTIDDYSDGGLQATIDTNMDFPFAYEDKPNLPWAGADSTNRFFNLVSDLFDPNKSSAGFTNRLLNAGNSLDTYDRYTLYRLLAQLGTDSEAESGKMNLNYSNALVNYDSFGVPTNISIISGAETNLMSWRPIDFFTVAADKLLRAYSSQWATAYSNGVAVLNPNFVASFNITNSFSITNIPVFVSNQFVYSPAINRLLQLAANMYDATTNTFYPSVFRPMFSTDSQGNVYISSYTSIGTVSTSDANNNTGPFLNARDANTLPLNTLNQNVNIYGVPWIIGVKKGFPNFNEFSVENILQITRKLQLVRTNLMYTPPNSDYGTNQMYIFKIQSDLGVECWNSYNTNYQNSVDIALTDYMQAYLTNSGGMISNIYVPISIQTNVPSWPGSGWTTGISPSPSSFVIPLLTNILVLTNSAFVYSRNGFIPDEGANDTNFIDKGIFPLPHFGLIVTNRFRIIMIDHVTGNLIDYVQFVGPDSSQDINAALADPDYNGPLYVWSTNSPSALVPWGVLNQIGISEGQGNAAPPVPDMKWTENNNPKSIALFLAFLHPNNSASYSGVTITNPLLMVNAPYQPTRTIVQYFTYQANDPLIHYTPSDLNFSGNDHNLSTGTNELFDNQSLIYLPNIGQINMRYEPWGNINASAVNPHVDQNKYNLSYKDPMVTNSDAWDFPNRKLPSIGWVGRIHRGTPWQTIFLKATNIVLLANQEENNGTYNVSGSTTWTNWTGNQNWSDAYNTTPAWDHLLFDIFTTGINDNATRGQLSVNQNHLAAWSAVFSGVVVLTNTTTYPNQFPQTNLPIIIQPAGINGLNSVLGDLVTNINNTRANTNLFPQQVFGHVGDILNTPQLTEQSPFLNWNNLLQQDYGISDEVYEWLPQQMMGLLKDDSSPTYVIYCYGQALRPAQNGQLVSGTYSGMVTNYQVMAESAVRAVIQIVNATNQAPHIVIKSYNILPPD